MLWFDIADKLLPPVYRAIKDMYAYAKALNDEFLVYVNFMERILKNFFIQTCDLQTVEYWERLLGLTVTEGETIEERKQEILEHLNNQHAITEPYVREQIERFFPGNEYRLYFEDGKPYDLNIDIFSEDIDAYRQALAIFWPWLNKMIPAHLKTTMARAIDTEFDRPVVISHGHYTALLADIGLVERIVPERMVMGGTVGLESLVGEDFEIDPPISLRCGMIDLSGNLQAESPSPQGIVEGGNIDLTGNLRAESPSPQGRVSEDTEESIEVLCGLIGKTDSADSFYWDRVIFGANDYWYSGIVNSSDVARLSELGLGVSTSRYPAYGPNGCVEWNQNYTYEIVMLYVDVEGTNPAPSVDLSNFYIRPANEGGGISIVLIHSVNVYMSLCPTWKLRITKNN